MRRLIVICTLAAGCAFGEGTWIDPATKVTWTAADSGAPVTFTQAANYCKKLDLDGHKDWTLPTIDELYALFGGAANAGGFRVKAPLKLTGWQWSSTPGKERGQSWGLDFGDGARASLVMGDSGLNRALCVRRSGN
jgi:hypothetical protein